MNVICLTILVALLVTVSCGVTLPINRRQRVYSNGTLIIEQVQRDNDAGAYTCQARNKQKHSARRDVEITVLVPPKILPIQSMNNVLREGMRAGITCQIIEGDLPISFRWEKDGQHLTTGGVGAGIATRRLDEYTSSLVIENISPKHTANYTCFAQNVAGVESFTVPLTVNVPPRWQVEPSDTNIAAGHDVVLSCQASGYPVPKIIWKKSIGEYLGEYKDFLFEQNVNFYPNGSLQFLKITKENEGHYLCEAKNGIGAGVSKLIMLKVNVPAHFPQKFKQLPVLKGEAAHMQCSAIGDNPIDITWKMNGQRIYDETGTRYMIREQRLDEGMVSELGISQTYRHDTGELVCYASNAFGQDEMKIQLIIQEVPEIPKNIRVNEQQSRSLQVAWTQPYAGNSPITSYLVQYKLVTEEWQKHPSKVVVPGAQTLATLQNLRPANSYHIRIIAENRLGMSEPSEEIQVITQEEAPTGAPQDVLAEPRTSSEIVVSWQSPPKDMWNGNLLGYSVGYKEQTPTYTPSPVTSTNNYSFKTVELGLHHGGETHISGLSKFTTYAVIVQAYNSRGAGPTSTPVFVRTKEDVPSSPPENVHCNTLTSQSLEVAWEPPNPDGQHGILLGYKVTYELVDVWTDKEEAETKVTTSMRTQIPGLSKYSNYSITVYAFTSAGDGVRSPVVYCRTDEDVPSPPSDIKAALSSANKIQVSWLPPKYRNGKITSYTFYMGTLEDGKEEGTDKRILNSDVTTHETFRLQERATYQFWVTASTKMGEGESSRVVTISPSNKVPARILSFSREITTPWKQDVNLTCHKVGIPTPQSVWKFEDKLIETSGRRKIYKDGDFVITDVQKSDQGNYTCSVENVHGKDEISYVIIVQVPPDRPKLVVASATSDSLQLEWQVDASMRTGILGYVINYKRNHGDWEELQVGAKVNSYLLENLWCATRYQLYITAFNKIGTGLPCDIVIGHTKGSVPVKPRTNQILSVNTTSVSVWVESWSDGGCPIMYFIVEYQQMDDTSRGWILSSNNLQQSDRVLVISDLRPATSYNIKVTAHNNAGSTVAVYNFTTISVTGVIPRMTTEIDYVTDQVPFYFDLKIIILTLVVSIVFTTLLGIAVLIRRKRIMESQLTLGESPSVAQIQNEQNRDQQYLAIRARNNEQDRIKPNPDEYIDDICPYATFQISKSPYPESTYSGNVYSGPYSSVKGSFLYHDSKQTNSADTYKLKQYNDSEYSKVRRKCGRLRDPHSESQESDNLGSTDSEVKKILSMHLPISEYDTLGSDSEGEIRMRTQSGSNQELVSFRHRSSRDMSKSGEDDTSSSSETSHTSGRKHFHARKSKSKNQGGGGVGKRQVRSSSGYSSHTEETTFSFSSHPSGKLTDLHAHDLDTLECDKIGHNKRRSSKTSQGSARFCRDTSFQIDV